jgi:hypothetical protein
MSSARPSVDAFTAPAPVSLFSEASIGLEVDFNLCDSGGVWLPARVCAVLADGSISIRAALTGTVELCVPLTVDAAAARLAPAGVHTVPLLEGQNVDFLRRVAPVAPSMCYLEQWQSGAAAHPRARRVRCS